MEHKYRQIAMAIIVQAVQDYLFYIHKAGDTEHLRDRLTSLKKIKYEPGTPEYKKWYSEYCNVYWRLYNIERARAEVEDVEWSCKHGEINRLCALAELPYTGEQLYELITEEREWKRLSALVLPKPRLRLSKKD